MRLRDVLQTKKPVVYQQINDQSVVDYLTDLNDDYYTKLLKIVGIYRKADGEAREVADTMKLPDIKLADVKVDYIKAPIKGLVPKKRKKNAKA